VLLIKIDGAETPLVPFHGALRERLVVLAGHAETARLDATIQAGLLGRERIRRLDDRRLVLEVTLLRMAEAGSLPTLADLAVAVESGAVPARGAAPAASAPAPGGALHGALVAKVRQVKPMLQATVEACAFSGPDDDGVVAAALRIERKMHRDRLESPEVQKLLGELLTQLCGRPVQLRVVAPGGDAARAAPRRKSGSAPPSERVRRLQDRFQGQLLEPDEPE